MAGGVAVVRPPPPEVEAGDVALVHLPSFGVEADQSVASSVASSRSSHMITATPAHSVRRKGRHSSLALG